VFSQSLEEAFLAEHDIRFHGKLDDSDTRLFLFFYALHSVYLGGSLQEVYRYRYADLISDLNVQPKGDLAVALKRDISGILSLEDAVHEMSGLDAAGRVIIAVSAQSSILNSLHIADEYRNFF